MSRLTSGERKMLPNEDFAWIDQRGDRHLPIENAEHVRDALARWPVTHFDSCEAQEESRRKILAAAEKFGIAVSSTDDIIRNRHDPPSACA